MATMSDDANTSQMLSGRIENWIDRLGGFLVPPYSEPALTSDLISHVQSDFDAAAASIFLVNKQDSSQLYMACGSGYAPEYNYNSAKYRIDESALTPYVFRSKKLINMSVEELEGEQDKGSTDAIPYRGKCRIAGAKSMNADFQNVLAVPIEFENTPYGVLKLENKIHPTEENKFPPEDAKVAQLLASIVALLLQQRTYTELWTRGEEAIKEHTDKNKYAQKVAEIISQVLNADCSSIWLLSTDRNTNSPFLRCAGGVGYKDEYIDHKYPLPNVPDEAKSTTAYIAASRAVINETEKDLSCGKRKIPYEGYCSKQMNKPPFRNILGMPLVEDVEHFSDVQSKCWGVLKVENRNPDFSQKFGHHDMQVCQQFVTKQIVPKLKELDGRDGGKIRKEILIEELGQRRFDHKTKKGKVELAELIGKFLELQGQEEGIKDVVFYKHYDIPKATFYREKRKWK